MADDTPIPRDQTQPPRGASRLLVCVLLLIGLSFRLSGFLNQEGRLLGMFPTEDGYLTLTIARNIGIGNGMTTAAGTLPTNGTQPLVTFPWAIGYRLVGGDKVLGVVVVLILELTISCLVAWSLYRLGRVLPVSHFNGAPIAALASAVWFANPFYTREAMNCLETGANALIVVLAVHAFVSLWTSDQEPPPFKRCVEVGALLGLAFWVRNDGCLLVLAACLTRALGGYRLMRLGFARRIGEAAVIGGTALSIAAPWLINNYARFGHLMPISGIAESHFGPGSSVRLLIVVLCDYILAWVPLSVFFSFRSPPLWVVVFAGLVVVLLLIRLARLCRRTNSVMRAFVCVVGLYGVALAVFYGLYFGVPYFLYRFLFPLSTFLAIAWAAAAYGLWRRLTRRLPRRWCRVAPALLVAYAVVLTYLIYDLTKADRFFKAVHHFETHVPEECWLGGFQTGIVGYFHDRTINLDGKVNADALRARLEENLSSYIVRSPIERLYGWEGMLGAIRTATIAEHFELEFRDPNEGLTILRRRSLPSF